MGPLDILGGKEQIEPLSGQEYFVTQIGFESTVSRLNDVVGKPLDPLPETLSAPQLLAERFSLLDRSDSWTISESYRYREIDKEIRRRQLKLEESNTGQLDQSEYIAANQSVVYYQYIAAASQQIVDFMRAYNEQVDPFVMSFPEPKRTEILRKKLEAARYLTVLETMNRERLVLDKLMMIDKKLSLIHRNLGDAPENPLEKANFEGLKKRQQEYKDHQADLMLRRRELYQELLVLERKRAVALPVSEENGPAGTMKYAEMFGNPPLKEALDQQTIENRNIRISQLDQLILNIMAGSKKVEIEGVTKGFLPQDLYGEAMPVYYTQVIEGATAIAMKNKGESVDADKHAMEQLADIRRTVMQQMVTETNSRAQYQMAVSELLTTQKLLGPYIVTEGSSETLEGASGTWLKEQVKTMIEQRKQGHLGYMNDMVSAVESGLFKPPPGEQFREWVFGKLFKSLTVEKLADRLGTFFSAPAMVPALQGALKKKLTAPLKEAFYYDKEQQRMLDPEDPADLVRIQERLKLVTEAMTAFQETGATQNFGDTINCLKLMPPISEYAEGTVDNTLLPEGRITVQYISGRLNDKEKPITANEGKTLHEALAKQKQADYDKFITAYDSFLVEIEKIIDVRINMKAALKQMQDEWEDLSRWYLYAAGGALVTPFVAYRVYRMARFGISQGWKGTSWLTKNGLKSAPATAAFIMHGFRTYEHLTQWNEHRQVIEKEKGAVSTELVAAGFVQDPENQDLYVYKDGDMEVKVSVSDLTQSLDTRKWEDWIRLGGDLTQGGILAWGMKVGSLRKAALPYVLVEAGVTFVNEQVKRRAQNTAITKFPAWLIATLQLRDNFEPAMGNSLFEIAGKQPENVRKKILWVMFNQEVDAIADWDAQLYPGGHNVHDMKEYFDISETGKEQGVFIDEFLPMFYALLYREYGTNRAWFSRIEGADVASNFSYIEVRKVMRKAILLHLEHLKERRYVDALIALETERAKADPDASTISILEGVVESLGNTNVFGKNLKNAKIDSLKLDELKNYKTRSARIGALLYANATNEDREKVFAEINDILQGTGFTFSSENLLTLIEDDITKFNVENVLPLSAEEGEPIVKPDWYHQLVPGQNNEEELNFGGHRMVTVHQSYYLDALSLVYQAGEKGAPNARSSIAKSQQEITEVGSSVVAAERDVNPTITKGASGKLSLTRAGGKPPMEFVAFAHWEPDLRKLPPAFRDLPVQAHFQESIPVGKRPYEGQMKDLGESIVLSTVVLGDPTDPEKMVVVQWAMVDWYFINKKIEMEDFVGLRYLPIFKDEREIYNEVTNNGKNQDRARHFMVGQPVISSASAFSRNERGGKAMIEYVIEQGKKQATIQARNERRGEEITAQKPEYAAFIASFDAMNEREFAQAANLYQNRAVASTDVYVPTPIEIVERGKEKRTFVMIRSLTTQKRTVETIDQEVFVIREDWPEVPVILKPGETRLVAPTWTRTSQAAGSYIIAKPEKTLSLGMGTEDQFNTGKQTKLRLPNLAQWSYTKEDYLTIRSILTTPLPENSARWFHEHTINTLLHQAVLAYPKTSDQSYFIHFKLDITDMYLSAYNKQQFLEDLFDAIMAADMRGVLTPDETKKIAETMKNNTATGKYRNSVKEFHPDLRSSVTTPEGNAISVLPVFRTIEQGGKKFTVRAFDVTVKPHDCTVEVTVPKGVPSKLTPIGENRVICMFQESVPPTGTTITVKDKAGKTVLASYPFVVAPAAPEVKIPEKGLIK